MKNKNLNYLTNITALTSSFLLVSPAYAIEECPMLPQADVIKAFNDPEARLNHADPAGMCNWSLTNGGTLIASVQKRPKAAEAKIIYDSFKSTLFAKLTRNAATPAVGQQAYFGMSAKDAQRGEAGFISLQGDTLFVLNYYASEALDDNVAEPLLALGRLGTSRKDSASQSFGKCEWFTEDDIAKFLGKGKVTIQRLGANHCIASAIPSTASITAMTDKNTTERSLGNVMERSQKGCTVVPMPKLGTNAHATFACPAPGDKAVRVEFLKNGTHVMITYAPANQRAGVEADIKALEGVVQRAFDRY